MLVKRQRVPTDRGVAANPIVSHLEELQSVNYHLVNEGFRFIWGTVVLGAPTETV